ncbi:hypothetical protein E2C01_029648 [Portunus trituberculatus]|uniref:Uncharacterized protein n=1 Tax=Portunus trituberculatus TaxID=210409 RepID=A0A5B7ENX5_PORTR|nr:hypothetical protein [Portunus trituberculatus]
MAERPVVSPSLSVARTSRPNIRPTSSASVPTTTTCTATDRGTSLPPALPSSLNHTQSLLHQPTHLASSRIHCELRERLPSTFPRQDLVAHLTVQSKVRISLVVSSSSTSTTVTFRRAEAVSGGVPRS